MTTTENNSIEKSIFTVVSDEESATVSGGDGYSADISTLPGSAIVFANDGVSFVILPTGLGQLISSVSLGGVLTLS